MTSTRGLALAVVALLLIGTTNSLANDKNDKKNAKAAEASAGWTESQMDQPATESLDLGMYNAIRAEGLEHSHVMDFAGGLIDGIGPRLTGSPNMAKANAWTRDQLTKMGCANAHLEDWGEFGMGWQQLNTWVRMVEPDTAIFVAQASGIHLTAGQQAMMLLVLLLASKGVAGVPRAVLVVLLATAGAVHLPTTPILLILGIDALMDMGRTMLNVVGNCLASAVIAQSEHELVVK